MEMLKKQYPEETSYVTTELREDGWYYTNVGYRFHGVVNEKGMFIEITDLEKFDESTGSRARSQKKG